MKKLTLLSSIIISSLFIYSTADAQYRSNANNGRQSASYNGQHATMNTPARNDSYGQYQATPVNNQNHSIAFDRDNRERESRNNYRIEEYRHTGDRYRDFEFERKHNDDHRRVEEHWGRDRW